MSTTSSDWSTSESDIRHPETLAELHPEEVTDQERRRLKVEKVKPKDVEQRGGSLGLTESRIDELRQAREPVYILHNPPITVTSE